MWKIAGVKFFLDVDILAIEFGRANHENIHRQLSKIWNPNLPPTCHCIIILKLYNTYICTKHKNTKKFWTFQFCWPFFWIFFVEKRKIKKINYFARKSQIWKLVKVVLTNKKCCRKNEKCNLIAFSNWRYFFLKYGIFCHLHFKKIKSVLRLNFLMRIEQIYMIRYETVPDLTKKNFPV